MPEPLSTEEALRVMREGDYANPPMGDAMTKEMMANVRAGLMVVTLDDDRYLRFKGAGRWAKKEVEDA